ncbi:MAG: sugar transferase [Saprospiraceae bacterium]|nr:sugar transferase [Saprospiraceae bacterium]
MATQQLTLPGLASYLTSNALADTATPIAPPAISTSTITTTDPSVLRRERTYRKALRQRVSENVLQFIEEYADLDMAWDMMLVETDVPINPMNINPWFADYEAGTGCVVNLLRLNDMRHINKVLESINGILRHNGHMIGCVETASHRKQGFLARIPKPFKQVAYGFDYVINRVWPKMPQLKKLYFRLTKGKNRVISEMETYGRLMSCGYKILDTIHDNGLVYFAAKKVDEPAFNTHASYGPIISLKRMGKNGKPIHVYKFRTMYPFSEYLQKYIYEAYGLQSGGKFKSDPRINTVGKFLRKYWLDEIPMLINLLRGDIKLIGVRPVSSHYLSLYPEEARELRKNFKPGYIPPFYADLPKTFDEIVASEVKYLKSYERNPLRTDLMILVQSLYNIVIKQARSN